MKSLTAQLQYSPTSEDAVSRTVAGVVAPPTDQPEENRSTET